MPSLQKGGNQDTEVTQGGHCKSLRAETEYKPREVKGHQETKAGDTSKADSPT